MVGLDRHFIAASTNHSACLRYSLTASYCTLSKMPDVETKFDKKYVLQELLLKLLKTLFGNDYMMEVGVFARECFDAFDF